MSALDFAVFGTYLLAILGVGLYFFNKNGTAEHCFVGCRDIAAWHVALAIVATVGRSGDGALVGVLAGSLSLHGLLTTPALPFGLPQATFGIVPSAIFFVALLLLLPDGGGGGEVPE